MAPINQYNLTYHTDDSLWKGLLESIFDDFLGFFFKNADEIFDLKKGFTYLDKELADLFPDHEGKAPKYVDKLVKVYTKAGQPKWILVHIEVQGQKDRHSGLRMFTYYYRIPDKYRMPVTAFAIFTDASETFHPAGYENSFPGTSILFEFNTYKVLNQDENNLKNSNNPFAMAVLTVLITLKSKKSGDEKLFELKHSLLRNLIRGKIPPKKIDGLMTFLRLYLRFENPEYNNKF
ncbi:hypothetical protein GVN16_23165 [Emticicia sp. CRIBPO]|uniref:hypothetical protein n=1 Tax=Emticicia sp. CRIBPO TaxID=2683258 RepID=UPI001411CC60|nr:hypothetical protein [Emticicia sp. CRIBPO]NBA88693.1 hypothetical protein [Emticicia sp. CRIBPO]